MSSQALSTIAAISTSPHHVLPGFLHALASPLQHYGVWAIFLFVLLEDFGVPVPGETVLIAGAVYAGAGRLNIVAVGVTGFIAAIAGDNIGYAIGRFAGRAAVERWGRHVFLTRERIDKAEGFFGRHGGKIIVVARFIEGLRQANGIVAGLTHLRWLRFLIFNAIGAALWVGTWVTVGYFAGRHITAIYHGITRYALYAAIAAAIVIIGYIALLVIRRRRGTRTPREAAAADEVRADEAAAADYAAGAGERPQRPQRPQRPGHPFEAPDAPEPGARRPREESSPRFPAGRSGRRKREPGPT